MSKKKKRKKKQQQAAAAAAASTTTTSSSQAPAAVVAAASPAVATPSGREKLEQKIEKLEEKLEEKKRAAFESTPGEDDASIPPVVEDEFFKQGDEPHEVRVSAGMSGSFDAVPPDPRSLRKLSPEARARRAQLSKWVKGAVAVSAAILAIGALRVTLKRGHEEPVVKSTAAMAVPAPTPDPVAVQQPVQTQEQQAAPAPVEDLKDEDPTAKDPKADTKDTATATGVEQAKDEQPKEKPTKTAAQEKATAAALLDGNNAGGAAAAAARSVALDPHDAEAWLLLGAAYQTMGNGAAAKQAFTNCTTQAKRGPVGECKSMLSQ